MCFAGFGFAVGLGFSVGDGDDASASDSLAATLGLALGFDSGDEALFLPTDFFFVPLCFGVGLGDSSGSAEEAVRVFRKSSRFRF